MRGIGLLVPDDAPLGNKPCVHHWWIGPPTYRHNGLVETTKWKCMLCHETRINVILMPFNEVQDEWVKKLA